MNDARIICPDVSCGRDMQFVSAETFIAGKTFRCARCRLTVVFASSAERASAFRERSMRAIDLAERNKHMREAFDGWLSNDAYWDGSGYRLKSNKRRRTRWSAVAVALFPDTRDFHEAAHAAAGHPGAL